MKDLAHSCLTFWIGHWRTFAFLLWEHGMGLTYFGSTIGLASRGLRSTISAIRRY